MVSIQGYVEGLHIRQTPNPSKGWKTWTLSKLLMTIMIYYIMIIINNNTNNKLPVSNPTTYLISFDRTESEGKEMKQNQMEYCDRVTLKTPHPKGWVASARARRLPGWILFSWWWWENGGVTNGEYENNLKLYVSLIGGCQNLLWLESIPFIPWVLEVSCLLFDVGVTDVMMAITII